MTEPITFKGKLVVFEADLVTCEVCGVVDAPFHRPRCGYVHARKEKKQPQVCVSCGDATDTLYSISTLVQTAQPRTVKRKVSERVCASCYYWRFGWDERNEPKTLGQVVSPSVEYVKNT